MADRHSYERSSSEIATSPKLPSDQPPPAAGRNSESRVSSPDQRAATENHGAVDPKVESQLKAYEAVLRSDVGISTLLTRLKQSIASVRDFAVFLKKRSSLEEEHAQALKKLCRTTSEAARRADSKQGSYARGYEDAMRIHDRMADNGIQFALSLYQMHEDLQELAAEKERGRKQWKQSGLSAEKRVQDSEAAMEKAKAKYNSLAEDYDRARTGERQSGRFGLKGPKSAAQVEEDLHRKMQAADSDYASKVQVAQNLRQELVTTLRPQAVKALEQLIHESDAGLALQMQTFATFNERLLLSNGLCVSPLRGSADQSDPQGRSLRDVVRAIDNDQDLKNFVLGFSSKSETKHAELKYEPHPSQVQAQPPPSVVSQRQAAPAIQQAPQTSQPDPTPPPGSQPNPTGHQQGVVGTLSGPKPHGALPYYESQKHSIDGQGSAALHPGAHNQGNSSQDFASSHSQMQAQVPQNSSRYNPNPAFSGNTRSEASVGPPPSLPPIRPVFGVTLEELFSRDGSAVPPVVYQCLQAVDLFGLDVEGIYRLSGTSSHVTRLRSIFDNDPSQLDFRNPESFFHDVNSVAGLLKQFFRDLPDPLLTRDRYHSFIEAARIDDDVKRRDSLHENVNSLPDPNYATLRALVLHLHRVQEHSSSNRMNAGTLAVCFGPTLMVSSAVPNIADAGWQTRTVESIIQNALMIFDED